MSHVRRILFFVTVLGLCACNSDEIGGPCGGGQHAEAWALLPDSGINAGDTVLVNFVQHGTQELAELAIFHLWPFSSGAIDPEPDPRVRVVHDDGRVLLDSIGSRYSQPNNRYDRLTWIVFAWIRDATLRTALYEGFRDEALWIELWHVGATGPGTRIRLQTDDVGIYPVLHCV
jgi:hypothetical protein